MCVCVCVCVCGGEFGFLFFFFFLPQAPISHNREKGWDRGERKTERVGIDGFAYDECIRLGTHTRHARTRTEEGTRRERERTSELNPKKKKKKKRTKLVFFFFS